jgi:hypothetical protein
MLVHSENLGGDEFVENQIFTIIIDYNKIGETECLLEFCAANAIRRSPWGDAICNRVCI